MDKTLNKKYELTEESVEVAGHTLFRIKARRDIPRWGVKKGDLGGYVEGWDNLSYYGDSWVGGEAKVFDLAVVYDEALVTGKAVVRDSASVFGEATVRENATAIGHSRVYDNAVVEGRGCVSEWARVCGNGRVSGNACIAGRSRIGGEVGGSCGLWNQGYSPVPSDGEKKVTKVTIVETLRREIVVEHPSEMTRDEVSDFVQAKYDAGHIVLSADDFTEFEIFTEKMEDTDGRGPAFVIDECEYVEE